MARIMSRKEFLAQPAGILYRIQREAEGYFEEIEVKGDTYASDFGCISLGYMSGEAEDEMLMSAIGAISRPIDPTAYGRDGCFDREAVFLVYDKWDIEQMRKMLDRAQEVAPDTGRT